MNQLDQILAAIAKCHLGIVTLETRQADSLDYHDVSVWAVNSALKAAFDAGRQSTGATDPQLLDAAELVVSRWEKGDLAEAVRILSDRAEKARAAAAYSPIVAITVRGGLIEDIDATIPVHAVVEDWDITDEDTGKKPARNIWIIAGELTDPRAAKLRRLIAAD
jgi:hypothetical protein